MPAREVLIVGAGPSGPATAIACRHHGLDYQVLEQGTLVDGHRPVSRPTWCSSPRPSCSEVGGVPLTTPDQKPTRAEALRYYRKVTDLFQLQVALHERVLAVEAEGEGEGRLFARRDPAAGARCRPVRDARARGPGDGLLRPDPTCSACPAKTCRTSPHFYSESHPDHRQRVVIVGGKNSACEAALELHRNGAQVTLVHRGPTLGDSVKILGPARHRQSHPRKVRSPARFDTRLVEIRKGKRGRGSRAASARPYPPRGCCS